ncbi:POK9 protein, partial [Sclerurus mexicanus]|nr:POK9 protein [Sclerurus mexicanus]
AGSLGTDLATAVDVTLIDSKPVKIPTGQKKPSTVGIGALVLGRSSAGLKGIIVCPGVIDEDFTGEICIVAYTLYPPIFIPKGSKIARLLPFQDLLAELNASAKQQLLRGDAGFGSTEPLACLMLTMQQRPTAIVTI